MIHIMRTSNWYIAWCDHRDAPIEANTDRKAFVNSLITYGYSPYRADLITLEAERGSSTYNNGKPYTTLPVGENIIDGNGWYRICRSNLEAVVGHWAAGEPVPLDLLERYA